MLSLRVHKNVLLVSKRDAVINSKLLGICSVEIDKLCIVTEFCPNGSILSYMKLNKPSNDEKRAWIEGIAAGMAHLAKEEVVQLIK